MSVAILENHFNGNDTHIVGQWISNGCQTFHVDDIDDVCENFNVPDRMKNEVVHIINMFDLSTLYSEFDKSKHCWKVIEMIALNGQALELALVSENMQVRRAAAKWINQYPLVLHNLIHDENWQVRYEVAKQGYHLDFFSNDPDHDIREMLANQGLYLDKFVHDPVYSVRKAVAKQGYGLDILVNDEDTCVLRAVAQQGYGLDKLMTHEYSSVRAAVAKQGHKPEVLIHDQDQSVRLAVLESGYVEEWLADDPYWGVREYVAKAGLAIDKLIHDTDSDVRHAAIPHVTDINTLHCIKHNDYYGYNRRAAENRIEQLEIDAKKAAAFDAKKLQ